MDVKCIFYSEFNITTGPELLYQTPDFMDNDLFKKISFYVIPNKELCGKLSFIKLDAQLCYMGLPVEILNQKKYERRSYEFNFGLITTLKDYEDQSIRNIYEQLLRKMATYLTVLEVEHEFLWVAERKKYLKDFIKNLYNKITNEKCLDEQSFSIPLDYIHSFTFQFQPKHKKPIEIRNFDVPIFINDQALLDYHALVDKTSDILQEKIKMFIDGKKYVKMIAIESKIDIEIVRMCLQHLLYYNVIAIIDIFQYSNIYLATQNITKIAFDQQLQQQCIDYVFFRAYEDQSIKEEEEKEDDFDFYYENETQKLNDIKKSILAGKSQVIFDQTNKIIQNPQKIVSLYSELCSGIKVKDFILKYFDEGISKQNIKHFVEFGLLNKLIYRLHRYAKIDSFEDNRYANKRIMNNHSNNDLDGYSQPRDISPEKIQNNFGSGNSSASKFQKLNQIEQMIQNQNSCFDQICVELDISPNELEMKIKQKDNIITYYK